MVAQDEFTSQIHQFIFYYFFIFVTSLLDNVSMDTNRKGKLTVYYSRLLIAVKYKLGLGQQVTAGLSDRLSTSKKATNTNDVFASIFFV